MVNMKKVNEYFITIAVSLIIVFMLSMALELELMFRCEKNVNFKELNVNNLSKFCTIEELEKKLLKNPDDFILNIHLGVMYESLNELDKANDHFKTALKLSGRSNFAIYSYAMFCARHNLYVFVSTLAEELSGNNRKTNLLKAKNYEQLAKSFANEKNHQASVKSYQIAYKYVKSIGDLKYLNKVKEQYAQEFINLADDNIMQKEVEEALSNLKNSLKIKKTSVANYKLGLILKDIDSYQAEKYMNEAFFDNPYVVNPYIYNSLLDKQLKEARILNKGSLINYYSSRLSRFKKKISQAYLFKEEVSIDACGIIYAKKIFDKTSKILYFEVKNNTKEELKNLFVKAELFVNGQKFEIEKRVINPANALPSYEILKCSDFKLPEDIELGDIAKNNDIFVRFYAKKVENAPWVLLKIDFLDI